jgi:hypothetical protein
MSDDKAGRPLFVTIIGILYLLIGVCALIFGIAVAAGVSIGDDTFGATLVGAVGVGLAIIYAVIGYGILKGWKIMWYLGVIFAIIGIIIGILAFPLGLIALVIDLVILYYLFRPRVKQFFKV